MESQAFSSDASIIGQIESGNIFRLFDFRDLVADNGLRALARSLPSIVKQQNLLNLVELQTQDFRPNMHAFS